MISTTRAVHEAITLVTRVENQPVHRRLHRHSTGITPEPFASSPRSTVGKPLLEAIHLTATHRAYIPGSTFNFGTPVQKAALAVGAVFLAVGPLGFVPGITSNYEQLTFAGHHLDAAHLGIFNVSVLHNLVHLAFGVAGIALAHTLNSARSYLIGGGVVYLVFITYGLVIDHDSSAYLVPVDNADNWLHLGLAVAMIASGPRWAAVAMTPANPSAQIAGHTTAHETAPVR